MLSVERGLGRLIDANANRASEGLRVLEDLARFELNDQDLAAELKAIRHDLAEGVRSVLPDRVQRLALRDTPGDVGTALSTPGEKARENLASIASAGGGRACEALRVLEEVSKMVASKMAPPGPFEALRYRVYEASRRVEVALSGRRARQWRLCVLISRSLCKHPAWQEVARGAIEGGAECLQLREKNLESRDLLEAARELVEIARPAGVAVIINDRADVALACGADGVHLGQTDLSVRDVRAIGGASLLVGVSCSTLAHAQQAARDGADYLGLGPMFPSATKPKDTLTGPSLVRDVLADPLTADSPHLAISGIDAGNVGELARLGCRGVAVSSAVCASKDPAGACREILDSLGL